MVNDYLILICALEQLFPLKRIVSFLVQLRYMITEDFIFNFEKTQ